MRPTPLVFWSRLIQAAAATVLGLSAVLLLAPSLGEQFFNVIYYHQPASPAHAPESVVAYIRFANGIIGAVMAGWMIAIIMIARGPFASGDPSAWSNLALPLGGWFIIDTTFSIAHGVWGNVLLNVAMLLLFGVPLAGSRRYFRTRR
jgi:hypothetical protein